MTTAGLHLQDVVRTARTPAAVRVRHDAPRRWHPRVVAGAVLALGMLGALLGTAVGIVLLGQTAPPDVLVSYGVGAGAGALTGLLLGLALSWAAQVLPLRRPAARAWVRHRR